MRVACGPHFFLNNSSILIALPINLDGNFVLYLVSMASTFKIKLSSVIGQLPQLVGMHYLFIPASAVKKMGGTFNVRVICTVNNSLKYQGGIVALGEGNAYISINKARLKQLGVKAGDLVEFTLENDDSEFGMTVPEELVELFNQDDEAKARFDALTKAMQRYIIHYVSSVKSSQLKIDRAFTLLTNLKKLPKGKENFRAMLGKE